MRGMKPLAAMRREGVRPRIAFIDCDAGPEALPTWAQWQHVDEGLADIDIEPREQLLRLDFRPLLGMVVSVSGTDGRRVRAVAELVQEAGAKRVIATCLEQVGEGEFIAFRQRWCTDTEGHLTEEEAHGATAA